MSLKEQYKAGGGRKEIWKRRARQGEADGGTVPSRDRRPQKRQRQKIDDRRSD